MGDVGKSLKVQASLVMDWAGGVPSIGDQSGDFEQTVIDNGVGDVTVKFIAGNGLKTKQYTCAFQQLGAAAASQLTTFGIVDVSDTEKRITVLREGAAGAVSALTDNIPFMLTFFAPGYP